MAEERNLGLARAPETTANTDDDATKAELQRRMEEARESITQTVTEIKDTVTNQYQHVRESISDALDWREQFRHRPVPFAIGALGLGIVFGYAIGGLITGGDESDYEEEDDSDLRAASSRSYAAQAITGPPQGATAYSRGASAPAEAESRPSYSSGYASSATEEEEEEKPGLIDRFKETRAYDRLQSELATLGDRFVDELSKTAQTVVLPMVFSKLKELVGLDLSGGQQSSRSQSGGRSSSTGSSPSPTAQSATGSSGGTQSPQGSSGPSYGTSENRPYGSSTS